NVVLAAGLTVIVLRRRWYQLEIFGILASFLSHLIWLYPIIEPMERQFGRNVIFPSYPISVTMLLLYWVIFRASYVMRKIEDDTHESLSTVAALLNTFLLLGVMKYQSVRPELAFYALLVLGALELGLGQLAVVKARRTAFLVLSTLGSCLMLGAFPFKYSGNSLAMFWLIGAQAFLFTGIFSKEVLFRRVGVFTAMLVAGYELVTQAAPFGILMLEARGGPRPSNPAQSLLLAVTALVLYFDSHFAGRRWSTLFDEETDNASLIVLSYLAAAGLLCSVYMYVPQVWVAVGLAVLAVGMVTVARWLEDSNLMLQAHIFAMVAALDVMTNNLGIATWPRSISFIAVATLLYLAARIVTAAGEKETSGGAFVISQGYTWAATFLLGLLVLKEAPGWRTAVAWIAMALVLAPLGRRLQRSELMWQAAALASVAFLRCLLVNLETTGQFGGGLSIRLVTMTLVAAGTYLLTLWPSRPEVRSIYTWGGTILATALAAQEAPDLWVTVAWMLLAVVLVLAARRFEMRQLLWQAHILAAISLARVMLVNFDDPFRGTGAQLITVSITAVALYGIAHLIYNHPLLESEHIPQGYTWAGSLLVTWLMWYQLQPISVAIGWALFGLIVFEVGRNRASASLQWQGYVALAGSFIRIFFVNLNAEGVPGALSPQVYTVLPLAVIYFYVYWRATEDERAGAAAQVQTSTVLAYFGSISVAAIMRTELPLTWVAAGWALLAVALLSVALATSRLTFLHQGLIALGAVAFRLVTYNFDSLVENRLITVLATVAISLLALPMAFRLRDASSEAGGWELLRPVLRRPEQAFFFIPVALLTAILALHFRGGAMTLSWGLEGLVIFVLALVAQERSFRLAGLALLMACVAKILFYDIWTLADAGMKAIALIIVGGILTLVAFLYSKYKESLREYL
ncbi:MAG: hypothetical protein ABIP12_03200, partial [Terriglobales bacterium]